MIGIEDPRAPPRLWTRIVDPGGGFCGATSSNAHRAIRVGGKPYYHILDPHSGQPAHATLLFVSVVFRGAARCWLADALSTACATMQPARALRLVERLGGDALIVRLDKSGRPVEYKSRRWNDLLYRAAPGK